MHQTCCQMRDVRLRDVRLSLGNAPTCDTSAAPGALLRPVNQHPISCRFDSNLSSLTRVVRLRDARLRDVRLMQCCVFWGAGAGCRLRGVQACKTVCETACETACETYSNARGLGLGAWGLGLGARSPKHMPVCSQTEIHGNLIHATSVFATSDFCTRAVNFFQGRQLLCVIASVADLSAHRSSQAT
ncbi:hypothetical protein T484DRAFT_1749954 [Baffinella frigidus]|nr:hypothetical protein T484DRAFT_1749954 [Cryptophyta sp. CCMP2293]